MKRLAGICLALLATLTMGAAAESSRVVYVQFIRGSDEAKAPAPTSRSIGPKLSSKLSPVFRWKNFWEVDRRRLQLASGKSTRVELPGDRRLELEFTKSDEIEARLYRKAGLITKTRHSINGPMSILGGEEDSRSSFFVVIRRDEPVTGE